MVAVQGTGNAKKAGPENLRQDRRFNDACTLPKALLLLARNGIV